MHRNVFVGRNGSHRLYLPRFLARLVVWVLIVVIMGYCYWQWQEWLLALLKVSAGCRQAVLWCLWLTKRASNCFFSPTFPRQIVDFTFPIISLNASPYFAALPAFVNEFPDAAENEAFSFLDGFLPPLPLFNLLMICCPWLVTPNDPAH